MCVYWTLLQPIMVITATLKVNVNQLAYLHTNKHTHIGKVLSTVCPTPVAKTAITFLFEKTKI